jgi:hypothetical protein
MVINMASKICAMVKEHAVLMLPIATSEAHVGLMGRRHCKYRITVNVSYISYKHCFNLSNWIDIYVCNECLFTSKVLNSVGVRDRVKHQ